MLAGFQSVVANGVENSWYNKGNKRVMVVMPTGTGKTEVCSHLAAKETGAGVAVAHRSVLVGQMSLALCRAGVMHDIVAQKSVVRTIVEQQMDFHGRSYYNPSAMFKVASVDTLPGRIGELSSWARRVRFGLTDEAHHVLRENKWGRAVEMFPEDARWILPTATPRRADGRGLGRDADGIVDELIEGPGMQWAIDNGYLTGYKIRAPLPDDLDLSKVEVGANGEYNQKQLRAAMHRSGKIIGNIVDTYIANTPGKLGIAFAVDILHATELTAEFNKKGVPCELITAEHSEEERRAILKRYSRRETLVLVNVDLFGEGFDLPAIEVVMFGRPTASYALFAQQFGRGLRLAISRLVRESWESYSVATRLQLIAASDKPVAYIHDHVGNILHFFGPPTVPQEWSLESEDNRRGGPSDAIPFRVCLNTMCQQPYERYHTECPFCKTPVPTPPEPTLPEQVDGDITLYTEEMLMKLFGVRTSEQAVTLQPSTFCAIPANVPPVVQQSLQAKHRHKLANQARLAQLIPLVTPPVLGTRQAARKFFLQYGMDLVQARLLGGAETKELIERIETKLSKRKVTT